LPIREVYGALATRPQGLKQAEAEERLQQFGSNVIREVRGKPLIFQFLANFTHMMAILLWVGGVIALIGQMPQLAIAVWMVNVINGVFSFWQEYRAERAIRALRQLIPNYANVLRDGEKRRILAEELVPGDVILLAEGDHISADGRLVDEAGLRVDQSTLTGESHAVLKTREAVLWPVPSHFELRNLVFGGTSVVAGAGTAVVFATGAHTDSL
jgi:magnesium-transporting ATPase (P-type)